MSVPARVIIVQDLHSGDLLVFSSVSKMCDAMGWSVNAVYQRLTRGNDREYYQDLNYRVVRAVLNNSNPVRI